MLLARIFVFLGGIFFSEGARKCPDTTKAHLTRCEMYYKCEMLPSDNYIWVPKNCPSGLIYDETYRKCVLPGDDWECQLGENDTSSSIADDENVYGVNNLSYLHKQMKGYDADSNYKTSQEEEDDEQEDLSDEGDTILIATTKDNETQIEFASKNNQNSSGDFESSGDGDLDDDDGDLENKSGYIPIPINSDPTGLVSSHLQRLSQLIKSVNNAHNKTMDDLSPNDINQFLALHKIKVNHGNFHKFVANAQAEPVPHNGVIDQHHLNQILDLQKKLNNFAHTHDALSTTPSPYLFALSGNGAFPSDATTVNIKTTNSMKNPRLPDNGHSTSQIIVNRPGGSVVFRLPNGNYQHNKNEGQISAETLKTLLELSKNMANQAPNTPTFVHSPPPPPQVQPIVQPILYNLPWHEFPFSALLANLVLKNQNDKSHEENQSMEKISAVSGIIPTRSDASSDPNDIGPSTIIHNHIPITVAHPPNPTNSIVNRYQVVSTTTARPDEPVQYDSYGSPISNENANKNNYFSYPPFSYDTNKDTLNPPAPTITTSLTSFATNPSPFSTSSYNQNEDQQPHYIQISQSRPDVYISPIYSNEASISNARKPVPTYASIDGGYTQKFYAPSPHLNENNVNNFVEVDRKPYPTLQPVRFVPVTSASSHIPNYVGTSSSTHIHQHQHIQKYPQIIDKIDNLDDGVIDTSENLDQNYAGESSENDDEYTNSNLEQHGNDRHNENVMSILANYNSQIKPNLMGIGSSSSSNAGEKKPIFQYEPASNEKHKQFVSLGGNFMSLETYQQAIEPYLGEGNSLLGTKIEVLTCATGVRQPNTTDCTRYFVCNAKTGKVLSYSCPPYTAFNPDTKICNAETYSRCYPDAIRNTAPTSNTKLAHQQMQQSILEANRIKTEALKAQQLAQLIKIETDKILNQNRYKIRVQNDAKSTSMPLSPTRPSNSISRPMKRPPNRKTQISIQPNPIRQQNTATVQRPVKTGLQRPVKTGQQQQPVRKVQGKRKIPCKIEGKLSDSLSQFHYFLCFKDKEGTMRARRLQCPANLTFCASTLICTSTDRCMNKFNRL